MQSSSHDKGPSLGFPRHHSSPSIDTHASGVAESTISISSLRLSQFPDPPTAIPQSQRGTPASTPTLIGFQTPSSLHLPLAAPGSKNSPFPSPTRSHFNAFATTSSAPSPSPVTPRKDRFPADFDVPRRSIASPDLLHIQTGALGRRASGLSCPIQASVVTQGHLQPDVAVVPHLNIGSPARGKESTPAPLSPAAAVESPSSPGNASSSASSADTSDSRSHCASLFTELLSSLAPATEVHPLCGEYSKSDCSMMTYPPATPFTQSPSQIASPMRHRSASSREFLQVDRHPPGAYVGVEPIPRPPSLSNRHSKDSETLLSHAGHTRIMRAISITKAGPAADVLGYAPATLHQVVKRQKSDISDNSNASSATLSKPSSDSRPTQYIKDVDADKMLQPPPSPSSPANKEHQHRNNIRNRLSMQSVRTTTSKSIISSIFTRISHAHSSRAAAWLRAKPLTHVSASGQQTYSREAQMNAEEVMALPSAGYRGDGHHHFDHEVKLPYDGSQWHSDLTQGKSVERRFSTVAILQVKNKNKVFAYAFLCLVCLVLLVVGTSVGLTKARQSSPTCHGNLTGSTCNLDATCVCTSSIIGQCNQLAQSLVSLIPTLNTLYRTSYTPNSLASAIWQAQGTPIGHNCAAQAKIIDISPALVPTSAPNRTSWIQTALIWNLVKSQDLAAVATMREFVTKASWHTLPPDGPVSNAGASFQLHISGFIFDFAAQMVLQSNVSFVENGRPSSAQIAQVGVVAHSVLDRMYSYAVASSVQQQLAMAKYWETVLQQKPEDLPKFLSAVSGSPILIPFDITAAPDSSPVVKLLSNAAFPPPLACYPGLSQAQVDRLSAIESSAFGMQPVSRASSFDPKCFPDRPLYGLLDVTRLRLPFIDSRIGVAKQAAVLQREVASRAVLFSDLDISALPSTTVPPPTTATETDPRQFGTMQHLHHVMLSYLSSIPDINVAISLVKFVLSSPSAPPADSAILSNSLASLPPLEVAVFGSVTQSDISSAVSSFSSPSGSLFFGSDQSLSLRQWAIDAVKGRVAWTELATSPSIVRDASFADPEFNSIWNPAFTYLHSQQPGVIVGVSNITNAFQSTGQFSA